MIFTGKFAAGLILLAGAACAAEKGMMHCFAYTPRDGVADADWQAFYKATDALPGKVPIVKRVWYGKLRAPLAQFVIDAESRKKLAGGEAAVTTEVKRLVRQHGVCMELENEAALKTYETHAGRKDWLAAYDKVRVPGTTTYDIVPQP